MGRRKKDGRNIHGILLLDKPRDCSSNKVLQRVKHHYNANKAGHTGTLDPLATGMLPICFGEATKLSRYLLSAEKSYLTTATLGVITDTGDADGTPIDPVDSDSASRKQCLENLSEQQILECCQRFIGTIDQIPPMYSAIKIDGQRLYKLAREGKTVERASRRVEIQSIKLVKWVDDQLTLEVCCSSGTYIRTLIEDIGHLLGCGAHVSTLRRLWVSPFQQEHLVTTGVIGLEMDQTASHDVQTPAAGANPPGLIRAMPEATAKQFSAMDAYLLPMDYPLQHLDSVTLSPDLTVAFRLGQSVPLANGSRTLADSADSLVRVYQDAIFIGLGSISEMSLRPTRVFNLG